MTLTGNHGRHDANCGNQHVQFSRREAQQPAARCPRSLRLAVGTRTTPPRRRARSMRRLRAVLLPARPRALLASLSRILRRTFRKARKGAPSPRSRRRRRGAGRCTAARRRREWSLRRLRAERRPERRGGGRERASGAQDPDQATVVGTTASPVLACMSFSAVYYATTHSHTITVVFVRAHEPQRAAPAAPQYSSGAPACLRSESWSEGEGQHAKRCVCRAVLLTVATTRGLLVLRSSDGVRRASQRVFFAAAAPGAARERAGRYGPVPVVKLTRQLDRRHNDPRERRSSWGLASAAHTGRHKYTRKCCFCHCKMQFCMEARRFLAKGGGTPPTPIWLCPNQLYV